MTEVNLSKRSLYCLMKESDDKVTILIRALAYDKNLVCEMETTTLRFLHLEVFSSTSEGVKLLWRSLDFASLQATNIRGTAVFVDFIFFE